MIVEQCCTNFMTGKTSRDQVKVSWGFLISGDFCCIMYKLNLHVPGHFICSTWNDTGCLWTPKHPLTQHTHRRTYAHTHTHTSTHACTHTHTHTHTYTCVHAHTHATRVHTYTPHTCTHLCTHTHTRTHARTHTTHTHYPLPTS